MKKSIFAVLIAAAILSVVFLGCSSRNKLTDEQKEMLKTVMNNMDEWETKNNLFSNYIQLQEIGGEYCLCVGYDDEIMQRTNEAVSTFSYDAVCLYRISSDEITEEGEGKMIAPAEMFMWDGKGSGRKLIGNTIWYYGNTYEQKYNSMENLFLKLNEE